MLRILEGNIFTSERQTLVNTVNCVGVMGAGIALEFKLRCPEMFAEYQSFCETGKIQIGRLWLYKSPGDQSRGRWVLNFPTKEHWRHPSKSAYLRAGLENFVKTYKRRGIESIAFPVLGAQNGGLAETESIGIMVSYLVQCHIDIDIYRYDPTAADDIYDRLKASVERMSSDDLKSATGLRANQLAALRQAFQDSNVRSVGQLATKPGIGEHTLSAVFAHAQAELSPAQLAFPID